MGEEEILAGLTRIEETMRTKWDNYGVDVLREARDTIESLRASLTRDEKLLRDLLRAADTLPPNWYPEARAAVHARLSRATSPQANNGESNNG